jgi:hypothetical protein
MVLARLPAIVSLQKVERVLEAPVLVVGEAIAIKAA